MQDVSANLDDVILNIFVLIVGSVILCPASLGLILYLFFSDECFLYAAIRIIFLKLKNDNWKRIILIILEKIDIMTYNLARNFFKFQVLLCF